jgi:hypothetical protein
MKYDHLKKKSIHSRDYRQTSLISRRNSRKCQHGREYLGVRVSDAILRHPRPVVVSESDGTTGTTSEEGTVLDRELCGIQTVPSECVGRITDLIEPNCHDSTTRWIGGCGFCLFGELNGCRMEEMVGK